MFGVQPTSDQNLLKALKLSPVWVDLQDLHFTCFLVKTLFRVEHKG